MIQMSLAVIERNVFNIDKREAATADSGGNAVNTGGAASQNYTSSGGGFGGKLTGIILSVSEDSGYAIIVMPDKDVFALRKNVPVNGMELVALSKNTATIKYNSQQYMLVIEENSPLKDTRPATARPVTNTQAPVNPIAVVNKDAPSSGTEQIYIERAKLMEELKDINNLIRSMLVAPMRVDGVDIGYRVNRINDDSPAKTLGIQLGDVITRVNGEELNNPAVLFNLLNKVDEINAVSMDILRGGEKKTIFVEIQ